MPLGASMQNVLRSNKSIMLDKSKRFRKSSGGYRPKKSVSYNLPEASPELLVDIREKLIKENKKIRIKNIIILSILIICSIIICYWLL